MGASAGWGQARVERLQSGKPEMGGSQSLRRPGDTEAAAHSWNAPASALSRCLNHEMVHMKPCKLLMKTLTAGIQRWGQTRYPEDMGESQKAGLCGAQVLPSSGPEPSQAGYGWMQNVLDSHQTPCRTDFTSCAPRRPEPSQRLPSVSAFFLRLCAWKIEASTVRSYCSGVCFLPEPGSITTRFSDQQTSVHG